MASILEALAPGSRVTILRLRSLGDCVLTTPAIALLKHARPDLRLRIVVEPRFAAVFAGNPDLDEVRSPTLFAAAGSAVCLNLHGGSRSLWMTAASLARHRVGFGHHAGAQLYNRRIPRAQEILGEERTVHTAEHLASAMFYLGVPRTEIPRARLYTTPWPEAPARYAVVHPFASAPHKQWPAEKFVAALERLQNDWQLTPIIIGAPTDDFTPFQAFRCVSGPLEQTKQILSGAKFFLGNDSGPAHMAAACGLPVTVLYGSSDPVVWAPWRTRAETFVSPAGLAQIKVDDVVASFSRLLTGVNA
ncbi:MAG: glycosyltransferase family 9 protein [Bryobacteraceae bacterium]|nr:glycosyltransferase family 9 protein [Bryobacteraceae bacterium]